MKPWNVAGWGPPVGLYGCSACRPHGLWQDLVALRSHGESSACHPGNPQAQVAELSGVALQETQSESPVFLSGVLVTGFRSLSSPCYVPDACLKPGYKLMRYRVLVKRGSQEISSRPLLSSIGRQYFRTQLSISMDYASVGLTSQGLEALREKM